MNLNIPETYYFETNEPVFNNVETMDVFLNYYLDIDSEILLDDGTYVEILHKGVRYGVHASGNGDFCNHKIEFEELGNE